MKIRLFREFVEVPKMKVNNITIDDIVKVIAQGGVVYSEIIKGLPDNDPNEPLRPVDVDGKTGEASVEIRGSLYYVDIEDITKIEFTK